MRTHDPCFNSDQSSVVSTQIPSLCKSLLDKVTYVCVETLDHPSLSMQTVMASLVLLLQVVMNQCHSVPVTGVLLWKSLRIRLAVEFCC